MRLNPFGAQRTPSLDKAAVSAPMDPGKMAPGPNQMAGLLDKAPEKFKNQIVNLQNRPDAFKAGSQPTRMIGGKQVAISPPLMGMKFTSAPEDGTIVKSRTAGTSEQIPGATRPQAAETPSNSTALVLHSSSEGNGPRPPSTPKAPTTQADQNYRMMHLSQPDSHPIAPYRPAQHAHQQASGKPKRGPASQAARNHGLPDAPEEKKGMSMGKKVLIGAAALLGITFLMSGDSSSSA